MSATVTNILLLIAAVAFFGGFPCLIWAGLFGGPEWAMAWGFGGLPVAILCGSLAGEIAP